MKIMSKYDRLFIMAGIAILIIVAQIVGTHRYRGQLITQIEKHLDLSEMNIRQINSNKWNYTDVNNRLIGSIYYGSGKGYNGLIHLLVLTDELERIIEVELIQHNETPSYFHKIENASFIRNLTNEDIQHLMETDDPDVVSGATISSRAILYAIKSGYSEGEQIRYSNLAFPELGILEITILFLLLTSLVILKTKRRRTQRFLWWLSLIVSFVFLGFIFNQPITLSRITAILTGYFPSLHVELYLYILLIGSVVIVLFTNRNTYCHSVCPFGAAQEIIAVIGKAKPYRPKYFRYLKNLQWSMAFIALLLALIFGNPSLAQYEVFGAFFQLTAGSLLFIALFIVIILSLFIKRPWCHFMCPVDGFFTYLKLVRKTIQTVWKS